MRAAPSVTVNVLPSRLACGALLGLALAAVGVSAVWGAARSDAIGAVVALSVTAHAAWLVYAAWRRPALVLRWDGLKWWLGPTGGEPRPGAVAIALDLGGAMLLRFRAAPRTRRRHASTWLPVERAWLPAEWHALRCAVYSPPPAANTGATDDPGG
ncbi:hypothetical protein [Methylibium sp.]|uniref:hypothetical protein n=1 Tax=Methylibium sp. TaxID=2067992 RepID=UPI00286BB779|nr:hypothetical protein [Methylibium sp.]